MNCSALEHARECHYKAALTALLGQCSWLPRHKWWLHACVHVARCRALQDAYLPLHACAQVHRDVQPGSLAWSDSVARWRLTGFDAWARKGCDAPLSYTLRYAAPEVRPWLACS